MNEHAPQRGYELGASQEVDKIEGKIVALEEQLASIEDQLGEEAGRLRTQIEALQRRQEALFADIDGEIDDMSPAKKRAAAAPHFTARDLREETGGRTSGDLFSDRDPSTLLERQDAA